MDLWASGDEKAFAEYLNTTDDTITEEEKQAYERYNQAMALDRNLNMADYAEENTVSCITFNLGYLPGGDHGKATRGDSSIRAIETGLSLLKRKGLMTVCIYSGGDSGFEEKDAVLSYLKQLDSKKYLVIISEYANRPNHPPIPVLIVKL